jgi:hypothetical protein
LQIRFQNPLWATVDELAEYMEEILEYSMVLRLQVPKQMQAAADQDMSTYTALLVVFTAL